MKPVWRARVAALLVSAGGLALLAMREWPAGAALLAIAFAILLLVTEQGTADDLPRVGAQGLQSAAASWARALRLEGNGIVVPSRPRVASRVLIPAEATPPPLAGIALEPETVLRTDGSALGVVIEAPGAGLESWWREAHGLPRGRGVEEAAQHLRLAFPGLGLGSDVSIARAEGRVRVRYRHGPFRALCRRSHEADAPWALQAGCPACSFAAILVARASGGPVRIAAAGFDGAEAWLELEVGERSPA